MLTSKLVCIASSVVARVVSITHLPLPHLYVSIAGVRILSPMHVTTTKGVNVSTTQIHLPLCTGAQKHDGEETLVSELMKTLEMSM